MTCVPPPQVHGALDPLWSTVLGLGTVNGVASDGSGNVVVAGGALGPLTIGPTVIPVASSLDTAFVITLDPTGKLRWHRVFDGPAGSVSAVSVDAAGNVYIAGAFNVAIGESTPDLGRGPVTGSVFVAKLDASGSTVWATGLDPDGEHFSVGEPLSLAVDPGRAVAIAGDGNGDSGFVAVFDDAGALQYQKGFNASVVQSSATFDSTGNLMLTGTFGTNIGGGALDLGPPLAAPSPLVAFAAKLDTNGNVLWQLTDGSYSVGGPCASTTTGTFLAGSFAGSAGIASTVQATGRDDLLLAELDDGGHPLFERTIPAGSDSIAALAADPGGGVVVAGRIGDVLDLGGGEISGPGVLLAKFDGAGRSLFSARFGPSGAATSVAVAPSGEVVLGGAFDATIDLGTGAIRSPRAAYDTTTSAMFVARYAQQPGPSFSQETQCPVVLDGGSPPGARAIALSGQRIADIALSPQSVYWTTGGEVMSASVAGSEPVPLAIGQKGSAALAIDSQSIYWVNTGSFGPSSAPYGPGGDGSIVSMALDGGAPRVLARSQNQPSAIAVDDAFVYFTAADGASADGGGGGTVFSTPIDGGAPAVLVSGIGSGEAVAAHGGDVVFAAAAPVDGGTGGSVIGRVPRAGGAWTSLATTDRSIASIALSDTTVYWVEESTQGIDTTAADGRIRSVPLAGGPVSLLADNQPSPGKIVLLGTSLYWANAGDFGPPNSSAGNEGILSSPLDGGTPTSVLPNVHSVSVFAIDDTHVAWVGDADYLNLEILTR